MFFQNWERRNQSDWAPVKIEALKRSAAVQCLINASDDQVILTFHRKF